jgi:hypothetical protein
MKVICTEMVPKNWTGSKTKLDMNKNSDTAEINPEIQTVINRWNDFAKANDIRVERDLYWSETCAELNGACICKTKN